MKGTKIYLFFVDDKNTIHKSFRFFVDDEPLDFKGLCTCKRLEKYYLAYYKNYLSFLNLLHENWTFKYW